MKTKKLKLSEIERDTAKFQFRKTDFSPSQVEWLVDNWNESILDPLDIWLFENKYYVLSGHHRYEAALRLKKATLDCRIHECDLGVAQLIALTSNANRLEYSTFEKSYCMEFLIDNQKQTFEEAIKQLPGVSVWLARRLYHLKYLRGTSWEENIDKLNIAPQAFEVGLFCKTTPLSKNEIECLYRVVTDQQISGNHLLEFLKDIRAWKEKHQKSTPEQAQGLLFNVEEFTNEAFAEIVSTSIKRTNQGDLALQIWWVYTLIQRPDNQIPSALIDSLLPLLRKVYAITVNSENEEEEPVRNARKKLSNNLSKFKTNAKS